jgi:hypothetical protein
MVYPHCEMRDQRALDVANHLLGSQLSSGQYVNLIDRPTVACDDSG